MFTGIVEETGRIQKIEPRSDGIRLVFECESVGCGLRLGDSVAVNGCCLTVVAVRGGKKKSVAVDLLKETWSRTNLQFTKIGDRVNLERALRADSRLGGHFVTGHVDGTGRITIWEKQGADYRLEVEAGPEILRYVIFKGSIAVDGISLTVAKVTTRKFAAWIIPHTRAATNLDQRNVGDWVNIEADLLGKYVEKFTVSPAARKTGNPRLRAG
jgi:riboflavin synthase